jgi:hypothetical protein
VIVNSGLIDHTKDENTRILSISRYKSDCKTLIVDFKRDDSLTIINPGTRYRMPVDIMRGSPKPPRIMSKEPVAKIMPAMAIAWSRRPVTKRFAFGTVSLGDAETLLD